MKLDSMKRRAKVATVTEVKVGGRYRRIADPYGPLITVTRVWTDDEETAVAYDIQGPVVLTHSALTLEQFVKLFQPA